MSVKLTQIQNHQRILITGTRGEQIFSHCQRVMDHYNRKYDVISSKTESISEGPVVFIVSNSNFKEYEPHIAVLDQVSEGEKSDFEDLAEAIPKSGTLVYNESDANAKGIGSAERPDVHRESFSGEPIEAAKSLLKRIGINETRFNQAQ